MNQQIEQLNKERAELSTQYQIIDRKKNEIATRLIEIQGILKYLEQRPEEIKKEK